MLLLGNVKAGFKTHTRFKENAIRSIILEDDVLSLNYLTKTGSEETCSLPDIEDADYFLHNTLHGYRHGQFSSELLENFLAMISNRLMTYIPTDSTGFGKLRNINYGRFIVAEAVEVVSAINRGFDSDATEQLKKRLPVRKEDYIEFLSAASKVALKQIGFDADHNVILTFKSQGESTVENILSVSNSGVPNFVQLKEFCNCLPKINFSKMTPKDAETFGKIIYKYVETTVESTLAEVSNSWERK